MSFGQGRRVSKQSNKYQRRNCCMKEKQKKKRKDMLVVDIWENKKRNKNVRKIVMELYIISA